MYIVIAGGGLMGLSLAEHLVAHQHDVLVIDPDPAVCEYAQVEIGTMVHVGSATSAKTLEAVGLRRADIAVSMMRNDADNLAFILLAKSYGVERRLVRQPPEHHVRHGLQLTLHRLADVGVVVAVAGRPPGRYAIDQLAAVGQDDAGPLGARDRQGIGLGLHLGVRPPDVLQA